METKFLFVANPHSTIYYKLEEVPLIRFSFTFFSQQAIGKSKNSVKFQNMLYVYIYIYKDHFITFGILNI